MLTAKQPFRPFPVGRGLALVSLALALYLVLGWLVVAANRNAAAIRDVVLEADNALSSIGAAAGEMRALALVVAMFTYLVMAGWSAASLIWNTRLSAMMAQALAPTGALFAFLALWSGALWGRPTWGTYWVWDARLNSTLILLFLYLGFMALREAIDDPRRADRACALLALVGAINVPIIYFSVRWWNTLHQGASVSLTSAPTMAQTMLIGMLLMALAAWCYTIAAALHRVRSIMIEREAGADWVQRLAASND